MSMSFRQLAKDVAIYGTGDVLLRATAFFTMPIYTRIFSLDDYGVLSFVLTFGSMLGAILILGGDSAYARYFFEAKDTHQKQVVTSSWFAFLALWSVAIAVICLPFVGLFSSWAFGSSQEALLFAVALLAAPVTLINLLCGQALRNQFRAQMFTVLNVVSTLLTVGCALFAVVVLDLGLAGVLLGSLAAGLIVLPIRVWTIRDMLRPTFSVQVVREMLAFGLPFVPAAIAAWIFASSDRIVLGKLSTLDQLGLFAVATSVTSVLVMINSAVGQAWSPHAFRVYEEHPEEARVFFGQVLTYILIAFAFLTVGVTAFADLLLRILAAPAFYPAAGAVGPLALGVMAYASIQVTALGISLMKQTKYLAIFCWIAAVINVALNVALVPHWGMLASSWSMALTYGFLTVAYGTKSQQLWSVTYEKRRLLTIVALTIIFTLGVGALPSLPLVEGIIMKGAYCLAYGVSLIVARVIDKREWQALATLLPRRTATATMAR